MAELQGYIDFVGEAGPVFLIPAFRAQFGGNALQVQIIDDHDGIAGFDTIDLQGQSFIASSDRVEVAVGDRALWAFRDASGFVHVGDFDTLHLVVRDILRDARLPNHPVFAAELAQFFRLDGKHPEVLQRAHATLAAASARTAEVWLDTQVLAPAIRRDLAYQRTHGRKRAAEQELIVLSRAGAVEIFAEDPWPDDTPMHETRAVAEVFGFKRLTVTRLRKPPPEKSSGDGDFLFVGSGGVARSVMREPRFNATPVRWSTRGRSSGATALGLTPDWNGGVMPDRPLFIGLAQSDRDQIEIVVDLARGAPDRAVHHLINVRPLGHWPSRQDKVDLDLLLERARAFQIVWIISNHRHRNLRGQPNNLAATSFAGRIVRALVNSLLTRHGRLPKLEWANGGRRDLPALALAGTVRLAKGENLQTALQRLLHAMLCEEAELHTAFNIVALVPYDVDERAEAIRVELGPRSYVVHLLSRVNPGRSREVVGWAIGVDRAKRDPRRYRLFCQGLLAAYDWEILEENRDGFSITHRGDTFWVRTINHDRELHALLTHAGEVGYPSEIILTNQAIGPDQRLAAEARGWTLLHHAEIAAWMKSEFGAEPFADW